MEHLTTSFTLTRRKPMEQYGHIEGTVEHDIMHAEGDDVAANCAAATDHVRTVLTQLLAGQVASKGLPAPALPTMDTALAPAAEAVTTKRGRGRPKNPPKVPADLAADVAKVDDLDVAVVEAKAEGGMTPKELQDYIMSLVHQGRVNPQVVKEKVYPKYGIARALDLKPDTVANVKMDIDALLKPVEAKKAANDLDL